jgi:hypothetical protein
VQRCHSAKSTASTQFWVSTQPTTGWMTDAASSSLHGIANQSRGNPMTSHMTHLRAQHHIADLRRETHAAVSRRRRGAASSVNPGFLGQPRLPRSTPARLAGRAGCGCLPPWHSDSAAAGGRTTTRSPNESRSFRAVRDEKQSRGSRPVPSPIAHPRCARSIGHGGPESQGPPPLASVRAGRAGPRVAGAEAADPSGVRAENSTASVSKSLASLVHRHRVPS